MFSALTKRGTHCDASLSKVFFPRLICSLGVALFSDITSYPFLISQVPLSEFTSYPFLAYRC